MRTRRALLHQLSALLHRRFRLAEIPSSRRGKRVSHVLRIARAPYLVGRQIDEVGVLLLYRVESGLDAAHGVDVFHLAFFAGGDDQAALAGLQRNLRLEDRERRSGFQVLVLVSPTLTSMKVRRQLFLQK